jgi:CRP/FNR family cyclic AMP-dependent transcriptional regulator
VSSIHLFDSSRDRVAFAPGDIVFNEGDPGDVMYAVVEGEVDILVGPKLIETAGPGAVVGEMAIIEPGPRSATVRARTECGLVPVGSKQFLYLVQEHPTFAITIMRIMADRLRRGDARV